MRGTPLPFRSAPALALVMSPLFLGGCDDSVGAEIPEFDHFEVIGEGYFPKLNDAGDVAFTRRRPGRPPVPMLHREGQLEPLPIAGDSGCVVALNNRGDVLGYDPRPVIWQADGTVVELKANASEVSLSDLNDRGVAIGGVRSEGEFLDHPVRWVEPEEPDTLFDLGMRLNALRGCWDFRADWRPWIGINDAGDIVADEVLLRADGTRAEFPVLAAAPPELYEITDSRLIVGTSFTAGGRGGDSWFYVVFDGTTGPLWGDGILAPRINELGDLAHTEAFTFTRPQSREHRFHRNAIGPDPEIFLLDTFPEFEDQELHQLEIMDLNDRGAIALHGFRPVLPSPAMVAVYRHPALMR